MELIIQRRVSSKTKRGERTQGKKKTRKPSLEKPSKKVKKGSRVAKRI